VMLVQKFLHVLMTTISFLNPFVIQLHLNEENTDMKTQISQMEAGLNPYSSHLLPSNNTHR
jgi:hypothetical protein